jgi:5-formyltetrahydrofolate cyclo-ligase
MANGGDFASQKQLIREQVKRKKLSVGDKLIPLSERIIRNLESLPVFPTEACQSIIYFAGKSQTFEVQTLPHVRDLIQRGFEVWLPKTITEDKSLRWGVVRDIEQDLEIGAFSVLEPTEAVIARKEVDFSSLTLAIMPGVAFDYQGHRMGYGQGYYDRLVQVANLTCPVVGLALEFQVFPKIPFEPHDSIVDYVVTEKCVRKISRK